MTDRKPFSESDKTAAWKNSGGSLDRAGKPIGTARCPYRYCSIKNAMQSASYGDAYSWNWVIDHKIARANNGPDIPSNYQAMHHLCNAQKSDSK